METGTGALGELAGDRIHHVSEGRLGRFLQKNDDYGRILCVCMI